MHLSFLTLLMTYYRRYVCCMTSKLYHVVMNDVIMISGDPEIDRAVPNTCASCHKQSKKLKYCTLYWFSVQNEYKE